MICGKANGYRIALVIYWLGLEGFCVKVLGLNASGFTIYQFNVMNQYDALLIELGEKNLDSQFGDWPVEIRIMLLGLYHITIFVIAQIISNWVGPGTAPIVIGMLTQLLSGAPTTGGTNGNNVPVTGGGFDLANVMANFGSAFIGQNPAGQIPAGGQNPNINTDGGRREFRPRFDE